jgi:crotonobetainyl-CoA:carnitine CoA-transferase CaiB-like acyl-CoA transferase
VPPRFGADGRAILKDAGFSAKEIDDLAATGALCEVQAKAPE